MLLAFILCIAGGSALVGAYECFCTGKARFLGYGWITSFMFWLCSNMFGNFMSALVLLPVPMDSWNAKVLLCTLASSILGCILAHFAGHMFASDEWEFAEEC